YSKLLGATFHSGNDEDATAMGIKVAMSWDAGIELVAPLPGRDSFVKGIIDKRGEGLIGVVFEVDDVDQAKGAVDELGIKVWHALDYSQEQIDKYLQGRFTKYKEYMLDPSRTCGVGPVIGQFEPK
ncbi:MAG: VOC family protein, partial [Chloroflexi bacterium]|nr:VOC family protein [Chloroflexota bacterium]